MASARRERKWRGTQADHAAVDGRDEQHPAQPEDFDCAHDHGGC